MASIFGFAGLSLIFAVGAGGGPSQDSGKESKAASFTFADRKYFSRFTKDDLHEYTPDGQSDLNHWTDMVTVNYYPKAKDGESLARMANAVLENYKANKAMVVKTASIPRTSEKPAEHLIVVLFPRPSFIEAAFARFKISRGIGTSTVYSHRIYGAKAGNEMSAWLKKSGPTIEKRLMDWAAIPPYAPSKP